MIQPMAPAAAARLASSARGLNALAALLGICGLLGNALDQDWLAAFIPHRPRMQPDTAACLLSLALAIALDRAAGAGRVRRACVRALGSAVAIVGALIAVEYVVGLDLQIDWRLPTQHPFGPFPGRPSPFTAAGFVALGGALALSGRSREARFAAGTREALYLATTFIGFVGLVGHAFGAGALYEFHRSPVLAIALPTSIALCALALAAWVSQPERGLLRLAAASGPGGVLLRRLGLTALIGGPLVGAALLILVRAIGLADLALVFALASVLGVAFALFLLATTAIPLERSAAALRASQMQVQELFDEAAEGIFIADLNGRYTDVNSAGCRLLQRTREEILGKTIVDLLPEPEIAPLWRARKQLLEGGAQVGEWHLERKDGSYVLVEVTTKILPDGRWQAFVHDITERKRLEQQMAQSLSEKEVLLKEIHHRVKNNLQVISSLFSLQRERTRNSELKQLLDESRTRVESIALVHEQLYRSADLGGIDLDEYLHSLLGALRASYGAEQVQIEVDAPGVLLEVEQAVPCALLVCELVSNSLKHAFASAAGEIWVRARREPDGCCVLEIGDDGRGMPADFDWIDTRTLGLRLVRSLARQLRASIEFLPDRGTRFSLRFAPWKTPSALTDRI